MSTLIALIFFEPGVNIETIVLCNVGYIASSFICVRLNEIKKVKVRLHDVEYLLYI